VISKRPQITHCRGKTAANRRDLTLKPKQQKADATAATQKAVDVGGKKIQEPAPDARGFGRSFRQWPATASAPHWGVPALELRMSFGAPLQVDVLERIPARDALRQLVPNAFDEPHTIRGVPKPAGGDPGCIKS
jgi:hypothetical protein